MTDYTIVRRELEAGTPAELICATCPWNRPCITPPAMSSREIDRQIEEAERKDLERDPRKEKVPVGMLLTTLMYAGKDTSAQLCPVFASRLSGPDGRGIADVVREHMRAWPGGEPS